MTVDIPWGPTGELVYNRTYSRTKPDGSRETWPETVERVVDGNLALVPERHQLDGERDDLIQMMTEFKVIPAGRHLWASGVPGRQYLFNPVVGDSEVTTRDGVRKISELVGQTVDVLSMSNRCCYTDRQWESIGAWRPATFIDSGVQETYRVKFESGREVVTTADHVWYSKRSRTKLKTTELVGEAIPVMVPPRPDEDADYWIGVMRGVVFGDGSLTSDTPNGESGKSYVRIYADDDGEIRGVFERFGHRVAVHSDGVGYVGRLPREWKLDMPSLDASPSTWRGFFSGWLAADGHVTKTGSVMLHNRDKATFDYASEGFTKAGLAVAGSPVLCRVTNPFDGSESTLYRLTFRRYSVVADDLIQNWRKKRFTDNNIGVVATTDKVVSVDPTGVSEQVYCCLEDATKSWTVNGVLTGNCHVSGWDADPTEHFRFTFLRLMEGGGVGANYSNVYLDQYPSYLARYKLHVVCSPEHPDYEKMRDAGVLSSEFDAEWPGAFPVEDSREGWADALCELLRAYYDGASHPDRVFDVSRVRGEGARLMTFGGRASGPLPLARMLHEVTEVMNRDDYGRMSGLDAMAIDHAIATCVVSGGNRRSARMAIMRWDDPQIVDFLSIKQDTGSHWTTNISVEVDDEFWDEISRDLVTSPARSVLLSIAEGMLANGEPGIWDSDLSNHGEPNPVQATNPCGEIPLEPFENCNLGHINLAAFVDEFWDELALAHRLMTRFLMRATYGDVTDPKQAATLARNRRIGVGHLGVASYVALNGIRYSEAAESESLAETLDALYEVVWETATDFADDLRIPVPVKCTTVAPTGTIAKLPGVSEGIHPIFAKYFVRRIRFSDVDEDQRATVDDYRNRGYTVEPCLYAPETTVVAIPTMDSLMADVVERFGQVRAEEIVESAADLTVEDMLSFQAMYQEHWADNAVSYTVNVPADDPITPDYLADAMRQFGGQVKGMTVFPDMGMPQSPYERLTKAEFVEMIETTGRGEIEDSVDPECSSGACPVR